MLPQVLWCIKLETIAWRSALMSALDFIFVLSIRLTIRLGWLKYSGSHNSVVRKTKWKNKGQYTHSFPQPPVSSCLLSLHPLLTVQALWRWTETGGPWAYPSTERSSVYPRWSLVWKYYRRHVRSSIFTVYRLRPDLKKLLVFSSFVCGWRQRNSQPYSSFTWTIHPLPLANQDTRSSNSSSKIKRLHGGHSA